MTKYTNTFLVEQFIDRVRFIQRLDEIISYEGDHFKKFKAHTFEYIQFTCQFADNLYMTNNYKFEPLYVLDDINDTSNQMISLNAYLGEPHIKERWHLNQVVIYTNAVNSLMLAFIEILRDFRGIISYSDSENTETGHKKITIRRMD